VVSSGERIMDNLNLILSLGALVLFIITAIFMCFVNKDRYCIGSIPQRQKDKCDNLQKAVVAINESKGIKALQEVCGKLTGIFTLCDKNTSRVWKFMI
jgi:hypothetical protein